MVGLILGMAASLALAGNGVKELRNIRKDIKKAEAENAVADSLIRAEREINDILKEMSEITETVNDSIGEFKEKHNERMDVTAEVLKTYENVLGKDEFDKIKEDVENTMEKVEAEFEKATEKKTETKAAADIEVEENNSDGKYPAKKKKAAAKKKAAKKKSKAN